MSKALQLHPLLLLGGLLSLLLALAGEPARAQELRPVPVLTQQVIDQTGTLSAAQREALTSKLERFERENGSQLVILIVASSQPEDIAAFAQRVGDAWKIGRKDVGDGLLIVVAKNDRKVRIEVAKALEGAVPDLAARQIIQSALSPAFKAGDYAGGLNQAVDQLQARIRGEALPAPTPGVAPAPAAPGDSGFDFEALGALFFIGVPILGALLSSVFGRKLGSLFTSAVAGSAAGWMASSALIGGVVGFVALILVGVMGVGNSNNRSVRRGRSGRGGMSDSSPVIWGGSAGSWGGGGSSDSGGGGGFSSGGGGDFGGGGASGDW